VESPELVNRNQLAISSLIVVGGGGHAKVLVNALLLQRRTILGFVDLDAAAAPFMGISCLGNDDAISEFSPDNIQLVNGVGSVKFTRPRQVIYEKFVTKNYSFATVTHPGSIVAPDAEIADGVQIMAGAVIQPGCRLGSNTIINTRASLDHDCLIDAHVHIAPGVTLSGGVHIGKGSHIGTGATVIQGIKVGVSSIVAAGAVVIRDVPDGVTVAGVPATSLAHHPALRS
jgi:sugar O-acyltransferase (sialic acid O-acetyltransferase NeuD family)